MQVVLRGACWAYSRARCIRTAIVADRAISGADTTSPFKHAGLEVGMAAGMLSQVVTTHKSLFTDRTAELLLSSMSAVVSGEFI